VFLVGGPAFSGTTLLALLLNQGDLVCLDEPDFDKPAQAHRGVPLLRRLFPDRDIPDAPARALDADETFAFTTRCAAAVAPARLGVKTCGRAFLTLADRYRAAELPVIAIIRDVRDALVRPLPSWVTEASLRESYRAVWDARPRFDCLVRYEDLVADPQATLARVAPVLGRELRAPSSWSPADVHSTMLKLDRHDLLTSGTISATRVGIWRDSGRTFDDATHATAVVMGYAPA
jgi:hypothetical protein